MLKELVRQISEMQWVTFFFFSLSDFVLKIDWSQRAVLGEGNDDNATDNFIRYLLITAIFSLTISLEP